MSLEKRKCGLEQLNCFVPKFPHHLYFNYTEQLTAVFHISGAKNPTFVAFIRF